MPAQKRGSDPHETQPKLRKLDEDGDALPSKIGPATNSLKTGQNKEMTAAAPRIKIKRPSSAEGENKPAKSSKQSSPPKDSCKTASDPPLQKAKLLKATSASCGEAPSQGTNSKACLKRTASTESDDDLSSDGTKVDFFKERDNEDKAHCIRKYSNKAKRKAEESSSEPQETSQGLSSAPGDPVQTDHSYGRFSDSTSPQSTDDANEKISSAVPLSEQGKQEVSHNATEKVSTDTSDSELGSTKASVKIESAAEVHKLVELQVIESQILLDNKVSASTGEVLNTITPVGEENEKKDQAESIRSQKDGDNETLASSEQTLCSVTEEVTSSGNGDQPADEKTDLTFISDSQTLLSPQTVSEGHNLSITCKTKDGGLETPGKSDEVLVNETNSAYQQVEISIPKIHIEENVTSASVAISETQMELKVQVSSEEEFNAADTVVNLCDDVNKVLDQSEDALEESDRDGVDFHQPAACPGPLVEVQLNHGFATSDSCTDTSPECKDGHEENQTEMLSVKNVVPEDQTTPEVGLQSQENHLAYDNVAKIAAEFKEGLANIDQDMISHCSAAPDTHIQEGAQVLNPDDAEETQSQELDESTTNLSAGFYEDHVGENLIENKETGNVECENLETQTVKASEISDPEPPVEIQKQEIQEVSESITVTSTEIHYDVTTDKCENVESLECAVTSEGQSTMEKQTIATFELSDAEAKVKLQIQEGPISECIPVLPGADLEEQETENSKSSKDAECVVATAESLTGVDIESAAMSGETCDMTEIEETHIQMNQVVSEHTTNIHDEALKDLENENCDDQSESEHINAAATSEEASNVIEEMEEMQTQIVSEPTTDISDKAQKVLENVTFKTSEDVASASAAKSQAKVNEEAKTALDDVSSVPPTEEVQSQMVSEPITDTPDETHKDLENANCDVSTQMEDHIQVEITEEASSDTSIKEMLIQMVCEPTTDTFNEDQKVLENETVKRSEDVSSVSAAQSETQVNEEAITTLDDVPNVAPIEEMQCQIISEPITDTPDEAHKDLENANCDVSTQIEDHVQVEITSEEASNVIEETEEMQIQMVSESLPYIPNETHKDLESSTFKTSEDVISAAKSQTEVDEEENTTLYDVSSVPPIEEIQGQMVSEPITDIPDETHKDLEITNDVSTQMEDHKEVGIASEEASNITSAQRQTDVDEGTKVTSDKVTYIAPVEETQIQMVSESLPYIPNETQKYLENSTFKTSEDVISASAAKSQTEVDEEEKTTLYDVSSVPPIEEIQSQMVSEPITDIPDETHKDLEITNDVSIQMEDHKEVGITSEEASNITLVKMQTQVLSEPTTDIPDETHKNLESSTFQSSEDACVSVAAQNQTDIDEGAKVTSDKVTYIAPVEETQIQMVSEPISDISVEFMENHKEEMFKTVENNEVKLESVAITQSQMEVEAAVTMERSNPAYSVEIEEKQTEVSTQKAENGSNTVFMIGIQTQTIQEVSRQITDNSSEEVHEDVMEHLQNVKNEDKINSEYVTEQKHETQSEMQITSASEISEAAALMDMQSGKNSNEIKNTTLEQVSEIPVEEIQNQRSQDIREQVKDTQSVNAAECPNKMETSEPSAETLIQKSLVFTEPDAFEQESFRIPSEERRENENKTTEECVDVAERPNEMEVQTTELLEEISQPTTPEQIQSQMGQEVSELTTDMESSAEIQIQKSLEITESIQDLPEQVEESFRIPTDQCEENNDKATGECVSITEQTNENESTEALEISQPTTTEQAQSQRGQKVSELATNTEVESDSISTECEQSINSTTHLKTGTQTLVAQCEFYYQKSDVEIKNQGNEEVSEGGENKDEVASECENVPKITMKPSAETEIYPAAVSEYQNHLAEESIKPTTSDIQTPLPFVHLENKDGDGHTEPEDVHGDVDVISGPIEKADSGLEEDTSRQIINEVKVDRSGSKIEGGAESSEVIVFVCDQTDDINVPAPEEQIKHQSEFHDNQVVYEPISSPESNSGGEICTTMELGETISFLDLQNTQTCHTLGDESNFLTNNDRLEEAAPPKLDKEEIVKGEICVPESQAAAEMDVDTASEAQLEQSNTTEDVKEVAEVSSSDDISVADGRSEDAAEKSEIPECISVAEVTEQVQEDSGLQDAAGVVVTTPAPNQVAITDGSSEEYVILEPIPENEIHFDIVTQAAAESGLSASLCPDDLSVGDVANESVLKDSQQSGLLEAEVQECETADGVKEPVLTSSDDVLDQEMETNISQDAQNSDHQPFVDMDITNSPSQHIIEDNNAAMIEDKCNFDLQQVQILQDIEIGHEIVVAEEENEEDGTIKKSPDQPTEDSPKQSDENINDESKQKMIKTTKQNKTAEKTEDEKKVQADVKPKKQEMNTQARTKARLAALAEQKAAASKRSANRQQLNLLALCQEIAEDIATDSMLLKKIEEEKQAVAAAEAAKAEASKKELPPADPQEADPVTIATPAGPEENSPPVTPAPEPSAAQPSTVDDPAEPQPAADPPKRRFFISQISVPLKAHEKKKLTRYQRLRQVELQREKMSWARVKKLKSDQANQMFSDVDWQASFTGGFLMSPAMPPPAPSPPKKSPTSPAATSQPDQPNAKPMPETLKTEPVNLEPSEPVSIKTECSVPEPPKPENAKTEPTKTELSKTVPVKGEAIKTEPPHQENRRTTRQSKAQASQAAAAPGPSPKVTRSASKKTLPAVPPPMPNGLNAQKPKPVEYKPYRPRPKYSFDDFELDDDDLLLGPPSKRNPSTQPPRPSPQQNPAAQSKKIPVSSQPANQTRLKSQTAPPGQTSGQSKRAGTTPAQLKPAQSKPTVTATPSRTTSSSKTAPSASAQVTSPEPVSASGQPKPAASASPQLKTASGTKLADSVSSETKPTAAKAGDASVPQKPENLPSQDQDESQKTADPLSSSLPSVETSTVSDDTKKCEEKQSVTSHSASENNTETAKTEEKTSEKPCQESEAKPQDAATHLTDASLQKEVKKLKEAEKDASQTIIDAGQKHFGPVACSMCGMLYSAANPEDESQHLLFHNQFISAVKYVGWKKERILAEYPDGKIILVLPDDPKYALKKVEEIREMVDNDLGFQQVETKCPSQTKTFLFISIDKKVAGCLITEHIQEGYRVIEEPVPEGSEGEKVMFERQRAWCCSTTPEPAVCGISRIWVVSMMRRQGIATRMLECLRNNFIYGSYLGKDEIAFSDPTPDGKLFAMHYFGTSQFLVYNFVSGPRSFQPKTHTV